MYMLQSPPPIRDHKLRKYDYDLYVFMVDLAV
jgi:hypothetical protein